MKAKMPPSQKPPEPGEYQCLNCDTIFDFTAQQQAQNKELACPKCGDHDRKDVVPIFMLDYPAEERMYTSADWHGGA